MPSRQPKRKARNQHRGELFGTLGSNCLQALRAMPRDIKLGCDTVYPADDIPRMGISIRMAKKIACLRERAETFRCVPVGVAAKSTGRTW